jgi:hypothetical protein
MIVTLAPIASSDAIHTTLLPLPLSPVMIASHRRHQTPTSCRACTAAVFRSAIAMLLAAFVLPCIAQASALLLSCARK